MCGSLTYKLVDYHGFDGPVFLGSNLRLSPKCFYTHYGVAIQSLIIFLAMCVILLLGGFLSLRPTNKAQILSQNQSDCTTKPSAFNTGDCQYLSGLGTGRLPGLH